MKARTVYPVEGRYLTGQPAIEHECDHPDCVASGAFTTDPPPKAAKSKTEGPAETGGSSDSESKEK